MGVKIIDEDGTVLHEFKDGLGVPLLGRVVGAAKFNDEADSLIVLNPHVAELAKALDRAMLKTLSGTRPGAFNELGYKVRQRVTETLYREVEAGHLKWLQWTNDEKAAYVRDVLIAPWRASDEFVAEFVSDADFHFERVRQALSAQ